MSGGPEVFANYKNSSLFEVIDNLTFLVLLFSFRRMTRPGAGGGGVGALDAVFAAVDVVVDVVVVVVVFATRTESQSIRKPKRRRLRQWRFRRILG